MSSSQRSIFKQRDTHTQKHTQTSDKQVQFLTKNFKPLKTVVCCFGITYFTYKIKIQTTFVGELMYA